MLTEQLKNENFEGKFKIVFCIRLVLLDMLMFNK